MTCLASQRNVIATELTGRKDVEEVWGQYHRYVCHVHLVALSLAMLYAHRIIGGTGEGGRERREGGREGGREREGEGEREREREREREEEREEREREREGRERI